MSNLLSIKRADVLQTIIKKEVVNNISNYISYDPTISTFIIQSRNFIYETTRNTAINCTTSSNFTDYLNRSDPTDSITKHYTKTVSGHKGTLSYTTKTTT